VINPQYRHPSEHAPETGDDFAFPLRFHSGGAPVAYDIAVPLAPAPSLCNGRQNAQAQLPGVFAKTIKVHMRTFITVIHTTSHVRANARRSAHQWSLGTALCCRHTHTHIQCPRTYSAGGSASLRHAWEKCVVAAWMAGRWIVDARETRRPDARSWSACVMQIAACAVSKLE